ncbi:MAG: single-stranded-DNA-specific exonuclease RecJ [Chloroflexi bacterium]|nr:single-stranded-DNA-specific exonuclease RecJ [Chloroflexota bacterium]OJW02814.1 MAG: single-stranded-DNA-specific exonuclease RecJ [Chloroflexi bacterium 54-19]
MLTDKSPAGITPAKATTSRVERVWQVQPAAPADFLEELASAGYSRLAAQLLYNRQLTTPAQIEYFFKATYATLADPFLIKDMGKAVERIKAARTAGEKIAIYGDFDADGVTACALLVQYFRAAGINVVPRIPHRVDEGYGLNAPALDRLVAQDVRLVITVDCGISNVAEVEYARKLGLDVIITDHHRPPEVLPAAFAILNTRQPGCEYPDKGMAGVGMAFNLVRALAQAGIKPTDGSGLKPRDLLDLVALGTVCDIAPLGGENRVLVAAGLKALNRTRRPGIVALIEAAGLKPGKLDTGSIGFGLGPRINAAGRIDDAIIAYELLLTDDLERARALANELSQKNKERQQKLALVLEEARQQVFRENLHEKNNLMVLSGESWAAGIVGLVAGRLCEEFNRPVLVLERGPETSKGSARSVASFNIIEAISECQDLLLRHGGHKQAAGFTLETAKLDEFTARLQKLADEKLQAETLVPRLKIDLALELDEIETALDQAATLEPFGSENPSPVYVTYRAYLKDVKPVGADGAHVRLKLYDTSRGRIVEAIAFRQGSRIDELLKTRYVDLVYAIEQDEWQGQARLQLRIIDFKTSV